eukprot:Plantae.Rhodophyta-Palmaria_palmata.ctg17648.p3 GENE.Plantae.Rhodophyta-Palmaria_palmata.ctg17648~~Plantae.Rhodophyta-Palmaria_palmata.ctg17648.p3  ORF type:complete len:115 (+),score=4.55 Plantae.Rhodophyta-Palmaria_palmata.ctg17648:403-747(+)
MVPPPRANGKQKHPGKVCVARRAMPGNKTAGQSWHTWRDYWCKNWGWKKAMAEPSMFSINTKNGVAKLEADNDDFFMSAPTIQDLDELTQSFLDAWQVTIQDLNAGKSIGKNSS